MIVFPNCKINLGLHVLQKRSDGFHDLETVFYPVALQDGLEIIHAASGRTQVRTSGSGIAATQQENTCYKAWALLKKDYTDLPEVLIHLHKVIPSGAGLGGGSADGAFTLVLLNQKFNLRLNESQLMACALELGSDCPFFIVNKPAHALGRGEVLEEINVELSSFTIFIVNPGIHISTATAFSMITPLSQRPSMKQIIRLPPSEWRSHLSNDFEGPIFKQHPEIAAVKEKLYAHGAVYASMSGSGSTVYGLFPKGTALPSFPPNYFTAMV